MLLAFLYDFFWFILSDTLWKSLQSHVLYSDLLYVCFSGLSASFRTDKKLFWFLAISIKATDRATWKSSTNMKNVFPLLQLDFLTQPVQDM